MNTLTSLLMVSFLLCIPTEIFGRKNRPIDLFNPLRSLELNNLEEESLKHETSAIIPSNHLDGVNPIGARSDSADFDPNCMQKVMIVTEIEYDEQVQCNHVSYENCYQAYKTVYKPQANENCQENFKKECVIEYEDVAKTELIEVCNSKAERNCSATGDQVCTTVYETICETKQLNYNIENEAANCHTETETVCFGTSNTVCREISVNKCEVNKSNSTSGFPETECKKLPREVCGPEKCPIVESETCELKEKTFVTPVPKEQCDLKPFKICTVEMISFPSLELVNECVQVPKEVCSLEKVNPRQVARPVVKKWCQHSTTTTTEQPETTEQEDVATTLSSRIESNLFYLDSDNSEASDLEFKNLALKSEVDQKKEI